MLMKKKGKIAQIWENIATKYHKGLRQPTAESRGLGRLYFPSHNAAKIHFGSAAMSAGELRHRSDIGQTASELKLAVEFQVSEGPQAAILVGLSN